MEQILDAICHHQWCHPNFSRTNWHRYTCWDAPFWALRTFSLAQLDVLLSFGLGQQKLFFHPGLDLKYLKKYIFKNKKISSKIKILLYFTSTIVLTRLKKDIVLVKEKNFWNSRLKANNLQNVWDHYNNLFKQWKVSTIFETECFFNLLL